MSSPKPLFHSDYGLTEQELVEKAAGILEQLNPEKIEQNPTMVTAIEVTARRLFDLIVQIKDERGRPWQVTEAAKLLVDIRNGEAIEDMGLLARALHEFGDKAPNAKFYLENEVMQSKSPASRESRRGSLIVALNVIETDYMRAKYGWAKPGITYKEIIDDGLIYLVSGEMLSNQGNEKAWVFWDEFASLRALIQKRIPDNPDDEPVFLLIDEAYKLFKVKGMAEALGDVATYYRSRKLMPVLIIQAFWQLDNLLQEQYWNLGNLMTFQMDNLNDAYKIAQQIFPYSAKETKYDAPSERSMPLAKSDREQYLEEANWIQRLGERKVLMRRYLDERNKEPYVAFVNKTRHVDLADLDAKELFAMKIKMVKESGRAVHIKDALREINKRDIVIDEKIESAQVPRRKK
jgi:hypothetical protein